MATKTYQIEGGTIAIITPGDEGKEGQTIHHFFLNCEAMKAGDGETMLIQEVNCPDCIEQVRAIRRLEHMSV
jgi:hypothetical protein